MKVNCLLGGNMINSNKWLIGIIVGLRLIVWGAYVLNNTMTGFGHLDLVTGPLEVVG
ncbi:MAG: hypothetical protein Q4G11_07595 [Gallicola sp.]|nr:hypothetical protein [Gallicola sp.]